MMQSVAAFSLRRYSSHSRILGTRGFAATTPDGGGEWRKHQLDKLSKKFDEPNVIDSDEDLQPMWKAMESRVVNRRTLTAAQKGGKTGRTNIRKTDEEAWLQAGLYEEEEKDTDAAQSTEKDK